MLANRILWCLAATALSIVGVMMIATHPPRVVGMSHEADPAFFVGSEMMEAVIFGRIVDQAGTAQADMWVQLISAEGRIVDETLSSNEGVYILNPSQLGKYTIHVQHRTVDQLPLIVEITVTVADRFEQEIVLPTGKMDSPVSEARIMQGTGAITGVVTFADTTAPIQFAPVRLYDGTGVRLQTEFTDSQGRYAFDDLDTAEYKVFFRTFSEAHVDEWYDNKPTQEAATWVDVIDGQVTSNINGALDPGATLSGRVSAEDTALPLPDVSVMIYDSSDNRLDTTETNATGIYTFTKLAAAGYRIEFDTAGDSAYFGEFYDAKSDLASADMVLVASGETITGIDATLRPGGIIAGQITTADGNEPITDARIWLYNADDSLEATTSVNMSGQYTFTRLLPGDYKLNFRPGDLYPTYQAEYYEDQVDLDSADSISLADGQSMTINAELTAAALITGVVTASDTTLGLDDIIVVAYTEQGCNDFDRVASAFTDASGSYTLGPLPADTYFLTFSPLSGGESAAYLDQAWNDQPDLENADPFIITAPTIYPNVNAALTRGGQITGTLTGADSGQPLVDVYVTFRTVSGEYIGFERTDETGSYSSPGLHADDYILQYEPIARYLSGIYIAQYYDSQSTPESATPVSVGTGETVANINDALQPGGRIAGRVTAGDTGLGLDDVFVEVYDESGAYIDQYPVESTGYYTTSGLTSGTYHVRFDAFSFGDAASYISTFFADSLTFADSTPVQVVGTDISADIDGILEVGGSVSGVVRSDANGQPLSGASVRLLTLDGQFLKSDTTNEVGAYLIEGVPTGSYHVYYSYFFRENPCDSTGTFASEYYDDRPDLNSADTVPVTAPEQTTNINAALAAPAPIPDDYRAYLPITQR